MLPQSADIYRKTVSLTALKGKTVVLNFWFTACGSCILEISELNKLQQQYHDFKYTLLTDAKTVHADYSVTICPISMVIDKAGIIRFVQVGGQDIATTLAPAIDATN
jgi:peroxiredoxin